MDTIIVNALLFLLFFAAGEKSGQMALSIIIWFIVAVLHTMLVGKSKEMMSTKDGREQLRREKRRDEKEWNEWRYKQDDR